MGGGVALLRRVVSERSKALASCVQLPKAANSSQLLFANWLAMEG